MDDGLCPIHEVLQGGGVFEGAAADGDVVRGKGAKGTVVWCSGEHSNSDFAVEQLAGDGGTYMSARSGEGHTLEVLAAVRELHPQGV